MAFWKKVWSKLKKMTVLPCRVKEMSTEMALSFLAANWKPSISSCKRVGFKSSVRSVVLRTFIKYLRMLAIRIENCKCRLATFKTIDLKSSKATYAERFIGVFLEEVCELAVNESRKIVILAGSQFESKLAAQ